MADLYIRFESLLLRVARNLILHFLEGRIDNKQKQKTFCFNLISVKINSIHYAYMFPLKVFKMNYK